MLRHLYSCALRLHPCRFRQRFADEMLAIFDQERGTQAALGLVLDSICSLLRQWILRPQFLMAIPTTSLRHALPDGIPSFVSLDTFRPRTSAVVHGMVLSLALFCTTAFAIRYSWIHILHVQIRAVSFDPELQIHPKMSPDDLRGTSGAPPIPPVDSENSHLISEHLQFEVIPVEPKGENATEAIMSNSPGTAASLAPASGVTVQIRLESCVGKYISTSPRLKISIAIEEEHLSLNIAGRPPRALSPLSQTKFSIAGVEGSWVQFIPDDRGRISGMYLAEDGHLITAQRQ